MKFAVRAMLAAVIALFVTSIVVESVAEARGRKGSIRIGGYNSHGNGSHYIGGR
ncbi:hypothetical protein [Kaistia sp. MMO-174]|uniref:hypothetical protein n=1 Tax=Kaistia sp. MMO-174 TaxID=3081256 RepID=UPI00301940EA